MSDDLGPRLASLDGKGYGAYKALRGRWPLEDFELVIDHVQGDPFAAPSRLRVILPPEVAGHDRDIGREVSRNRSRCVGVEALLARTFDSLARNPGGRDRGSSAGSGRSGQIRMAHPGQLVLPTTAVRIREDGSLEARFTLGLPARGRRILGPAARTLITETLPQLVRASLPAPAHEAATLRLHAETNEDADALRDALPGAGLVAFVADGARLPRGSGVDDCPLEGSDVVPFQSPDTLRVQLDRPNGPPVWGMGIRPGVTLVTGGGYHGKSTLLKALAHGVWNHRPGDGREQVVADPDAVTIRAEDGRSVAGVDISAFIDNLPAGSDTRAFTTPNASGSTSQAAAMAEALEAGASLLLLDEDTCATNLMIRDRRMQALVPDELEPITPLLDRIRTLVNGHDVSFVLVMGGSGDYLDVADTVISMERYRPVDRTDQAREVARTHPTGRTPGSPGPLAPPRPRRVEASSVDPSWGRRAVRLRVHGTDSIEFGGTRIDTHALEQIVLPAQLRTVAEALVWARTSTLAPDRPLSEVLDLLEQTELDELSRYPSGDLAAVRRHDIAAVLNRLRTLEVHS